MVASGPVDDEGDHAPDLEGGLRPDLDGLVGVVFRGQEQTPVHVLQALDRQFPVHGRDDDAPWPGFLGPIHHQDVAGLDAGAAHGFPAGADIERGRRMGDAQVVEVQGLVEIILGRAGKTGGHRRQVERQRLRGPGLEGDGRELRAHGPVIGKRDLRCPEI